ncbi:MAG: hypothetical protein GXO74_09300 [Calditrichaeota bacterium]|nr:hypothetical protein [Calditrichota bacterium]
MKKTVELGLNARYFIDAWYYFKKNKKFECPPKNIKFNRRYQFKNQVINSVKRNENIQPAKAGCHVRELNSLQMWNPFGIRGMNFRCVREHRRCSTFVEEEKK